jgi:hypothetical protein
LIKIKIQGKPEKLREYPVPGKKVPQTGHNRLIDIWHADRKFSIENQNDVRK